MAQGRERRVHRVDGGRLRACAREEEEHLGQNVGLLCDGQVRRLTLHNLEKLEEAATLDDCATLVGKCF